MTKPKKNLVLGGLVLFVFLVGVRIILPNIAVSLKTQHLKDVRIQQSHIFSGTIMELTGLPEPESRFECFDVARTLISTKATCESTEAYKYNPTPLPSTSKPAVLAAAAKLDKLLQENGWSVDRPQDRIHTNVDNVPQEPVDNSHINATVPFHKNIGAISCNMEIEWSGPTDGSSPGVPLVNNFLCRQTISYFDLHINTHVRSVATVLGL